MFVNHVASAREKSFDEIDNVAQGRVWAGVDAMQNGLVDKLGSYDAALDAAAARADLGEDYKVEYIEPPLGWRQALAVQTQVLAARLTHALVPQAELHARSSPLVGAAGSGTHPPVAVHGSEAGLLLLPVLRELNQGSEVTRERSDS